jgi:hypothetical protein
MDNDPKNTVLKFQLVTELSQTSAWEHGDGDTAVQLLLELAKQKVVSRKRLDESDVEPLRSRPKFREVLEWFASNKSESKR